MRDLLSTSPGFEKLGKTGRRKSSQVELEGTVALHVQQGVVRKEKFEIIIHATISVVSLCWSFSKECKPLLLLLVKKPGRKTWSAAATK